MASNQFFFIEPLDTPLHCFESCKLSISSGHSYQPHLPSMLCTFFCACSNYWPASLGNWVWSQCGHTSVSCMHSFGMTQGTKAAAWICARMVCALKSALFTQPFCRLLQLIKFIFAYPCYDRQNRLLYPLCMRAEKNYYDSSTMRLIPSLLRSRMLEPLYSPRYSAYEKSKNGPLASVSTNIIEN